MKFFGCDGEDKDVVCGGGGEQDTKEKVAGHINGKFIERMDNDKGQVGDAVRKR